MTEEISGVIFGVWFLIGAALVFWMQAGFAMVEAGFTRAKNTGNILMKNLMDFCIGTVVFILIGFSLLLGEDVLGFIGKPGFDIFTSYKDFDWSNFVFNLVFCATTATKELQIGVLAGGEMIICRHLVGCFVGQFDYEDGFSYLCGGRVSVLIGGFYCGSLRVGGTIHHIHRPHSFPQFIYLLLCQCRNRCALFIS